jgi:hypothetical protein
VRVVLRGGLRRRRLPTLPGRAVRGILIY